VQVPVAGRDELAVLSENFNRMSRVLAQTSISKDFLSSILSHMTEPLMVIGNDGRMQMANVAATRLLGYSEAEMVGRSAAALLPVEKAGLPGDDTCLRPVENMDLELVSRDGTRIPVVYSCSPLRNADGQPSGSIVTARDMSERQRLETAVRRSEKMSAVGQLAAGVAHEINNPLGVILGYSQALVRRLAPGDALETPLRSIEKEAVRCKNLVQDLLTFSRVSRFEKEPVELNKAVGAALTLVSAQARIGRVAVEQRLADGLPRILGNANQIQQVVINLATNAMDAIGQEGKIEIRTELERDGALSWVCLKVIDSGAGIPPEIAQRIFEPFFTTKPVGKGTGLGLSLIHEIMKKHSGTIDVASVPGRTEFCARFPVRESGDGRGPR
jgi:PAS domain S-box-containing protein